MLLTWSRYFSKTVFQYNFNAVEAVDSVEHAEVEQPVEPSAMIHDYDRIGVQFADVFHIFEMQRYFNTAKLLNKELKKMKK